MEKSKNEIAKEITESMNNVRQNTEIEHLIKDNKIQFKVGNDTYRIRQPEYNEVRETLDKKRQKYVEFLKDDSYLFREQIIQQLNKKGFDIVLIDKQIADKQKDIQDLQSKVIPIKEEKQRLAFVKQIKKLQDDITALSMKKTEKLEYSIEDSLSTFYNSYITYLVLEKQIGEDWKRAFETFEEFQMSSNSQLLTLAFYYITFLVSMSDE